MSLCWSTYYPWPASYARYIQYVFARYQANHCILSPIHFDYSGMSIPSRAYNERLLPPETIDFKIKQDVFSAYRDKLTGDQRQAGALPQRTAGQEGRGNRHGVML